jgi:hypothetical protein
MIIYLVSRRLCLGQVDQRNLLNNGLKRLDVGMACYGTTDTTHLLPDVSENMVLRYHWQLALQYFISVGQSSFVKCLHIPSLPRRMVTAIDVSVSQMIL